MSNGRERTTNPGGTSNGQREEVAPMGDPHAVPERSVVAGPSVRGNLPLEVSSFVGREAELAEVGRLLAGARILTLVGAGGSGKTRLALRVARGVAAEFTDGTWLVELAPLADPALVPEAVARSLSVNEQAELSLDEALARYLEGREVLLVLDNCEHLVDACATLVEALLRRCPRLRVLATSREALRVDGEKVWTVPPLAAPDPQRPPELDVLGRNEAVRLFVERASAVAPGFVLGAENSDAVASVCGRLDGLPLAIELAAARVRVISVAQISSRLDDCFSLLTDGGRTALPRHKTLKATMDWSHDLLPEGEQILFRRLSVFAGGWTLPAAEEVCAREGLGEADTLDLLTHLVDKSLVLVAAEGGEARYWMLEPVRQYASERLVEVGEAEEIRHRHAAFCLALAEEAELGLEGARQAAWLERLDEEHDNIRSALSWSLEQDDEVAGASLQMGAALGEFWYLRGYLDEGRRWLEEALQKAGQTPTAVRASALQWVSWLAVYQGDLDRAENAGEEGLALEGVDLFQTRGGDSIVAELQRALGLAAAHRGEFERERRFFEESLELSREAGNDRGVANSLLRLGMMWRGQGDFGRATELLEEALALCRESGDPALLASILIHLGCTFFFRSDLERGTALSEEAAAMLRGQKHRAYLAMALDYLGWAALLGDDSDRASALYAEGLELQREVGDKPAALESLGGLACVAGSRGETGRAARLFGAAQELREVMGLRQELGDRALQEPYLAAARSWLDDASWEAAWSEGRAMSFESAVEYALAIKEHPVASTDPARPPAQERPGGLTTRELEVLQLVASGMSSARVAEELFLSPRTVDTHLTSIYRKLGVSSRAGATRFALEHDLA